MNSQLATVLAVISAQLDNLIQTTESYNQTLNRIITKVEKKSENTNSPMNLYTSNELIQIIVANDRLKKGITVIRLNPKRIKHENPTPPVATHMIKESRDRDYSKLSPTIKCYKCQGYGHVAANCPTPVKAPQVREPPVTNSEPLPPLLPTSPSSLPLLLTPTVIVCSGHQHLPPLLLTPTPMITELVDVLSEELICHVEES